jgi:hypothetical protein
VLADLSLLADDEEPLPEAGPFGAAATGARRVAELVAYELGLAAGSVAGRDAGTGLAAAAAGANSGLDLTAAFAAAARVVVDRLAGWEAADAPPEEKVAAVLLTGVEYADGVAVLSVDVLTEGGAASATVTLDTAEV